MFVVRSKLVCWRLFNWPTSRKSWAGFCSRVQEKTWLSTKTNISYCPPARNWVDHLPSSGGCTRWILKVIWSSECLQQQPILTWILGFLNRNALRESLGFNHSQGQTRADKNGRFNLWGMSLNNTIFVEEKMVKFPGPKWLSQKKRLLFFVVFG